jgi:Flp pilus assembly pilin Flp
MIKEERGTETLEWGLVCGLIVLGAIIAMTAIGPKISGMWTNLDTAIK